jgi:hypothetical protein
MNTGKLNMLGYRISQNLPVFGHGIHLYFLGMLDKTAHDNRMIFRYIGSQFKKTIKLFCIRANVHGRSRQYIRRADKNRKADTGYKLIDIFHGGQGAPLRLVNSVSTKH